MSEHSQPSSDRLQKLWQRSLLSPWQIQHCQKRKEQRNRLLQIGCLLAKGEPSDPATQLQLQTVSQAVGVLCLRNYVHLEAFEVIRRADFTEPRKLEIFEAILEAVWKIRRGQAFDHSLRMDEVQNKSVRDLCLRSMELKSGTMAILCLRLGAMFGTAKVPALALEHWGGRFGVVSQMIEDICLLRPQTRDAYRLEDLILRKPNWVWAALAEHGTQEMQSAFRKALQTLPDTRELDGFLAGAPFVEKVFSRAVSEWNQVLQELKKDFRLKADHRVYEAAQSLGALLTFPLLQK